MNKHIANLRRLTLTDTALTEAIRRDTGFESTYRGNAFEYLQDLRGELTEALRMARGSTTTGLTASDQRVVDSALEYQRLLDSWMPAFEEQAARWEAEDRAERQRADDAARARTPSATDPYQNGRSAMTSVNEPDLYRKDNQRQVSFLRDLARARLAGDFAAADRLRAHTEHVRALGNTNATGGSGGEFAPPQWLVDEFVALARPGRVTADLFAHEILPEGVSSVNLPKVATGTSVAPQTTQNTALSQTDLTTTSLSSGIVTIGGKQIVSRQLLDQSAVSFDEVLGADLAAAYATQLGTQAIAGTGTGGTLRGYLSVTSGPVQTWSPTGTPTAGGLVGQVGAMTAAIAGGRFLPPDTIVMHPRRWAWVASSLDSTGRPVVDLSGDGSGVNAIATGDLAAQGAVGKLQGIPVYIDASVPTNLGANTNQDVVLVFRRNDIRLWESDLRFEAFEATYADTAGVLFRAMGYSAMIPDRYPAAVGRIVGTGLVPPVFGS